ncbi:MAG: divalent-cation tolerance protein CutA [Candidatus Acidiferrales bacterium]|jgi:periplasmic divalent cation tolerance protein
MDRNGTIVVLVTCGSGPEAKKIARAVVEKRLAACVNVVTGPVESVYRWKGKVESAREFLLIVKTTARRFEALKTEILRLHSYDVPEIIAVPVKSGAKPYLQWVKSSVQP